MLQNTVEGFDLIGDIHGYADELIRLLEKLGYRYDGACYRHPSRRVIFLGDFIDRGPGQRAVIDIARSMTTQGEALAVMGNHEFNAIAYHTPALHGGYLRPHNPKNQQQHQAFLDAYPDEAERSVVIDWFATLPLWLDLGNIRVVHACWDQLLIHRISKEYGDRVTARLIADASNPSHWAFEAVETLLKGKEVQLPEGYAFADKDGVRREAIRVRWWDAVETYSEAFIGPEVAAANIPDIPLCADALIAYPHTEPPLFLGHYWLEPPASLLKPNIACLDFSVARPGGQLVAYRWDGEHALNLDKFCAVDRLA